MAQARAVVLGMINSHAGLNSHSLSWVCEEVVGRQGRVPRSASLP